METQDVESRKDDLCAIVNVLVLLVRFRSHGAKCSLRSCNTSGSSRFKPAIGRLYLGCLESDAGNVGHLIFSGSYWVQSKSEANEIGPEGKWDFFLVFSGYLLPSFFYHNFLNALLRVCLPWSQIIGPLRTCTLFLISSMKWRLIFSGSLFQTGIVSPLV